MALASSVMIVVLNVEALVSKTEESSTIVSWSALRSWALVASSSSRTFILILWKLSVIRSSCAVGTVILVYCRSTAAAKAEVLRIPTIPTTAAIIATTLNDTISLATSFMLILPFMLFHFPRVG